MKNISKLDISLRNVVGTDLPIFFVHQLDPQASYQAAFISRDPTDRKAFDAHYAKILNDDTVTMRTILMNEQVVGHVAKFVMFDKPEITYGIDRAFWNRGITSRAVALFLSEYQPRPIFAHAAADNLASIRVLEKCGFVATGCEMAFAKARGQEIEEVIMKLE